MVGLLDLPVNTIGDLYVISSALPAFQMPDLSYETVSAVLPDAFTIAVLAAIESLLSAVVADEMIGSRHNSNMELVAQGVGNSASALFGGIPATGAIARTAANIKNGGTSPVAGHGTRSGAASGSGPSDALRGTDPDALHSGHPIPGGLQYEWLAYCTEGSKDFTQK